MVQCLAAGLPVLPTSRSCEGPPCTSAVLQSSPVGPCDATCGGGSMQQVSRCFSTAILSPQSLSACLSLGMLSQQSGLVAQGGLVTGSCGTEVCGSFYRYVASPLQWSACSARCGGGVSTRPLQCRRSRTGELSITPETSCVDADPPVSQLSCNSAPCTLYQYTVSPWTPAQCYCGGLQHRSVSCMQSSALTPASSVPVPLSLCEANGLGPAPASNQSCSTQSACKFCELTDCSGHGTCLPASSSCGCATGYSGRYCEVAPRCAGPMDRSGHCCSLGSVLDADMRCCTPLQGVSATELLTANGTCCPSGQINACGECDGAAGAILSVTGQCCASGATDAMGVCCNSGRVDVYGVCDGVGSSGVQLVTLQLQLAGVDGANLSSPLSVTRLTLEDSVSHNVATWLSRDAATISVSDVQSVNASTAVVTLKLLPFGGVNAIPFTLLNTLLAGLTGAITPLPSSFGAFSVLSVAATSFAPLCGNGVCELGERPFPAMNATQCPSDCPIVAFQCPHANGKPCNGAGTCLLNSEDGKSGVCACWPGHGYAGDACGECAPGFVAATSPASTGSGGVTCVRLEVPPALRASPSPSVTARPSPSPPISVGTKIAIIVPTSLFAVAMICAVTYACWPKRPPVVTPVATNDALAGMGKFLEQLDRDRDTHALQEPSEFWAPAAVIVDGDEPPVRRLNLSKRMMAPVPQPSSESPQNATSVTPTTARKREKSFILPVTPILAVDTSASPAGATHNPLAGEEGGILINTSRSRRPHKPAAAVAQAAQTPPAAVPPSARRKHITSPSAITSPHAVQLSNTTPSSGTDSTPPRRSSSARAMKHGASSPALPPQAPPSASPRKRTEAAAIQSPPSSRSSRPQRPAKPVPAAPVIDEVTRQQLADLARTAVNIMSARGSFRPAVLTPAEADRLVTTPPTAQRSARSRPSSASTRRKTPESASSAAKSPTRRPDSASRTRSNRVAVQPQSPPPAAASPYRRHSSRSGAHTHTQTPSAV